MPPGSSSDPTYATSRQVHSALAKALAPKFIELGWRRRKGSTCGFTREADAGRSWVAWFQLSSWGDSWSGNSFTLNVGLFPPDETRLYAASGNDRVIRALAPEDMRAGQCLERRLKARMPDVPSDHYILRMISEPTNDGRYLKKAFEERRNVDPRSWEERKEVWLFYFSLEDVADWSRFLKPRLSALLEERCKHL